MRLGHIISSNFNECSLIENLRVQSNFVRTIQVFSLGGIQVGAALAAIAWLTPASLPGGHSKREPPDPISNSEVKTLSADGSVGSPHVRVGHCQALNTKPRPERPGFFCFWRRFATARFACSNTRKFGAFFMGIPHYFLMCGLSPGSRPLRPSLASRGTPHILWVVGHCQALNTKPSTLWSGGVLTPASAFKLRSRAGALSFRRRMVVQPPGFLLVNEVC